ncbi:predicted protein [Arabidopsis lyrata subsp. lyrata]|uniref:Predicted protein n=1 Tax=Arabidopsis lyrata subsp. lyrata TaxID=81972 RepID=D7MII5_ARALL|nr:predicted protein [Arabidopsis lyrata subsp. lyrata]
MNAESNHELGAGPLVLVGKATTDGTFNARAKATVTEQVILKANATLTTALVSLEYMGLSSRTQLQLGTNYGLGGAIFYRHNSEIVYCMPQRASPHLSLRLSCRENIDSDSVACGLVESGMRTGKIILSAKMVDLKKRDVVFECGYL